jgi:RND family efflux transporter MFP subunit
MKRIVKLIIVIILLVAAVVGGRKLVLKRRAELSREKAVSKYPLPVQAATVKKAPFEKTVRYLGKVDSNGIMEIKARISGQVSRRIHLEGDPVKKGALLVALDGENNGTVRELKAQIAVVKSKIASLRIQWKNLATIYKRDTDLYKNGAISEEAWELSENRLAATKGQITALKSEITQIETKLTYTRVISPYDGVLSRYYIKKGDVMFPGQPICQIIKKGSFKVKVEVTPDDLRKISVGLPVSVGKLTLKVSRIYPAVSQRSLAIIEADFGKIPCPYKVGEIIPVKIKSETLTDAWIVPIEAVLHRGKKATVFGVIKGKIVPVAVTVLASGEVNSALASDGLKAGLQVVCAHESRLMVLYKDQPVTITGEFIREARR